MVVILVFGFVNFKEEQVSPAAVDALAGQLIFLCYLVVFACRHAAFDLVFLLCELQGRFECCHFIVDRCYFVFCCFEEGF